MISVAPNVPRRAAPYGDDGQWEDTFANLGRFPSRPESGEQSPPSPSGKSVSTRLVSHASSKSSIDERYKQPADTTSKSSLAEPSNSADTTSMSPIISMNDIDMDKEQENEKMATVPKSNMSLSVLLPNSFSSSRKSSSRYGRSRKASSGSLLSTSRNHSNAPLSTSRHSSFSFTSNRRESGSVPPSPAPNISCEMLQEDSNEAKMDDDTPSSNLPKLEISRTEIICSMNTVQANGYITAPHVSYASLAIEAETPFQSFLTIDSTEAPYASRTSLDGIVEAPQPSKESLYLSQAVIAPIPYSSQISMSSINLMIPAPSKFSLDSQESGMDAPKGSRWSISSEQKGMDAPMGSRWSISSEQKGIDAPMGSRCSILSHLRSKLRASLLNLELKNIEGGRGLPSSSLSLHFKTSFKNKALDGRPNISTDSSVASIPDYNEESNDSSSQNNAISNFQKCSYSKRKGKETESYIPFSEERGLNWAQATASITELGTLSIFKERPDLLKKISQSISFQNWSNGEVILLEQSPLKTLYWLVQGTCLVTKNVSFTVSKETGQLVPYIDGESVGPSESLTLQLETQDLQVGDWFPYIPVDETEVENGIQKRFLLNKFLGHPLEVSVVASSPCQTACVQIDEFFDAASLNIIYSMIRNTPIILFTEEFLQQEYLEQRAHEIDQNFEVAQNQEREIHDVDS
jgi:hypothetical protein